MSAVRKKLLFDIGSTYFKVAENGTIRHWFRDFNRPIFEDLMDKCGDLVAKYRPEEIQICSSANGGLSTLIIGISNSFSLKYAINIAFNSGINIIDTVLYHEIERATPPVETIDVVIIVGGIDGVGGIFDEKLIGFLEKCTFQNIVYVGSADERNFLSGHIRRLVVLENIITEKLKINERALKTYLTDLYQADIMGKEDIKQLYEITANQIFSTPYVVNRALPFISRRLDVTDPFIVIDIGGATTDIHYSRDLVSDNITGEGGYDRLVFKKLGVYKSRESLVHTARQNEFVYELLNHLNVTENVLEEESEAATKVLMQLAIFLVLYKVSRHHSEYVELKLENLNNIVLTGGITKVLEKEDAETIIRFFYKKLLHFHQIPEIVLDRNYEIWTYGMQAILENNEATKELP
ncbi:glutamate mutase L [Hydrogenimonas urashimensis]|uniref:glutamate mutase L n=1 Tax=Hydrogenimonas urashimensis TaxID=2740515 RepID=UPI001914FE41|nr:glutamate mutase L [Hydrogenimonas urashimensis]